VTGERLLPRNAPKTITQGDPVEAILPATADPNPLYSKGGVITIIEARPAGARSLRQHPVPRMKNG